MGKYHKALELYLTALRLALEYPGNDYIHPKPLTAEIGEIYYKLGDKEMAREYLDRYEKY
jgi:tetratricopeptide (TPR) repeat protein